MSTPKESHPLSYSVKHWKLQTLREVPSGDEKLETPEAVARFWRTTIPHLEWFSTDQECMVCFHLNTRRRLTGFNLLAQGTTDTLLVSPTLVFRAAIVGNASALILAHNHPSGDATPSEGDVKVTRDFIRAGQLLKIDLLDHIIMGVPGTGQAAVTKGYSSLRELGYFY